MPLTSNPIVELTAIHPAPIVPGSARRSLFPRPLLSDALIGDPAIGRLLESDEPVPCVEDVLPDEANTYAIAPRSARMLARLVLDQNIRSVLEFGAGSTSVVFARALAELGGGRLTSVEQHPEWCREQWALVQDMDVDAQMVVSDLRFRVSLRGMFHEWAAASAAVARRGPYDLALIDGPPMAFGRDGSLHLAIEQVREGGLIVIDDAGRWKDQWSLFRIIKAYSCVAVAAWLPRYPRNGVAILRRSAGSGRFAPSAFCGSLLHAMLNWQWRVRHPSSAHFQASDPT
jgi:predicted O-methyltransferase YrrM